MGYALEKMDMGFLQMNMETMQKSLRIGDYVTFGGRVAVRDRVSIVSKVRLAANSCITKNIKEPGDYGGFPAVGSSPTVEKTSSSS